MFGNLGKNLIGKYVTPGLRGSNDGFMNILADGIDIGLEIAEELIEN